MFKVSEHTEIINDIFKKHGLPTECYEIVPCVLTWCAQHNKPENNAFRPAKCLCNYERNAFHIVFRDNQTDDMIQSVKNTMEDNGFSKAVCELDTDLKYFIHLVHHEIACTIMKTTEQAHRDEWAFKQMGIDAC